MKNLKKLFYVVATMLTLMIVLCGCSKNEEIAVDGSYQVVFSGYNGYGTAEVTDAHDWADSIDWTKYGDDMWESMSVASKVTSAVTYTLSKTEGLSNGDKIQLSIKCDNKTLNEYGFSGKDKTVEIEVSGLQELEVLNPFDYVTLSYTGAAPYAKVEANVSPDFPLGNVSFNAVVETEGYVKNGDTVKVSIEMAFAEEDVETYCRNRGYRVTQTSMEYTVSGIKEFVLDINEITDEMLVEMNKACSASIANNVTGWYSNADSKYSEYREFVSNTYDSCYLLTYKKDLDPYGNVFGDYVNHIIVVHKISTLDEGEVFEYYYAIKYSDVKILPDGTYDIDYNDYQVNKNVFIHGTYMYHYWGGQSPYSEKCVGYETIEALEADFFPSDIEEYDVVKK